MKAEIDRVTAELLRMPRWKLKWKVFLNRYRSQYGSIHYAMDPDWKYPLDVRVYRAVVYMFKAVARIFSRKHTVCPIAPPSLTITGPRASGKTTAMLSLLHYTLVRNSDRLQVIIVPHHSYRSDIQRRIGRKNNIRIYTFSEARKSIRGSRETDFYVELPAEGGEYVDEVLDMITVMGGNGTHNAIRAIVIN